MPGLSEKYIAKIREMAGQVPNRTSTRLEVIVREIMALPVEEQSGKFLDIGPVPATQELMKASNTPIEYINQVLDMKKKGERPLINMTTGEIVIPGGFRESHESLYGEANGEFCTRYNVIYSPSWRPE